MLVRPSRIETTHLLELTDDELAYLEFVTGYDITSSCTQMEYKLERGKNICREIHAALAGQLGVVNSVREGFKLRKIEF